MNINCNCFWGRELLNFRDASEWAAGEYSPSPGKSHRNHPPAPGGGSIFSLHLFSLTQGALAQDGCLTAPKKARTQASQERKGFLCAKGGGWCRIFAEMRPSFPVLVPLYGEQVIFGAIFPFHANALRLPFHAEAKKNRGGRWPVVKEICFIFPINLLLSVK